MRVVTDAGSTVELGVVETGVTVGIIDYSRRDTDDYGVTTVVERGFARRMSVRLGVPFDGVDGLQRTLADLRATSALWVADDSLASLSVRGFYKDFDIDLAVSPLSFCTLTVEGLTVSEPLVDSGADPAPDGQHSTLQVIQPIDITDGDLLSSSVPENDYPEWSGIVTYPLGARIIKAAAHRIYESAAAGNLGNDPEGSSGQWIDVGPTNRWAMFDQALGTASTGTGTLAVTIDASAVQAVALLDVVGGTVRVQGPAYDRTLAVGGGTVGFLDLTGADGLISVTITGIGAVSVGTLLLGKLVGLGITEASPTAGLTDYSRKEVDEFGDVTIVQRAWAKRMTANALIGTDGVDDVFARIAAVRARPALWIGQAGMDSLTIYGFFKDFSIDVGENYSKVSLSIEGLSKAAKVAPLGAGVNWPDIANSDPVNHPKPEDGATVGAPPGTPVGDVPAQTIAQALKDLGQVASADDIISGVQALLDRARYGDISAFQQQLLGEDRKARFEALTHFDGIPMGTRVRQEITERIDGYAAIVESVFELSAHVDNGIADVVADLLEEITVRASADEAEVTARTAAVAAVSTDVADVAASLVTESTARATAIEAETTQRELAISLVSSDVAEAVAAIVTEATTRASADEAETTTRTAQIATLTTDLATANAAILTEATTRSTEIEAEATAREALAASFASDLSDATAALEHEATVRAGETGALASDLASVSTTVDGNTASVTTLLESVDGLSARWGVRVEAGGEISGVILNNDGNESDLTVLADTFRVVSPGGGNRTEYSEGVWRIYAGGMMSAWGAGFGSTNQFIRWTGPAPASLSDCTEANGTVEWLKVDGSGYYGGSLSAGTLRNAARTTSISGTADVTTGDFGSNGGNRVVTVGFSLFSHYNITTSCPVGPDTPSVTVQLYRGQDATGTLLSAQTFTGTYICEPGFPSEPGFIDEAIGGSFTFTDTAGGITASYYVRITSRTVNDVPQTQSLGIISIEE